MLSDEEKEIFNNLKDYMQSEIDNGYHKFIYNDLDWDFKCIDCINAIDKVLKQSKEIERINEILTWKQKHEEQLQKEIEELKNKNKKLQDKCKELIFEKQELTSALLDSTPDDKIKAKIEELQEDIKYSANPLSIDNSKFGIKVLQSLLEKE